MTWRVRRARHVPPPAVSVIAFVWIIFFVVMLKAVWGRQTTRFSPR